MVRSVADLGTEAGSIEQGRFVDAFDVGERSDVRLDQGLPNAWRVLDLELDVEALGFGQAAQLEDPALNQLLIGQEGDAVRAGRDRKSVV